MELTYADLDELGFAIEEVIYSVTVINTIWLNNDGKVSGFTKHNYDHEIYESHYDQAEYNYIVYYKDEVVLDMITSEEVEEFFTSGKYKEYLD